MKRIRVTIEDEYIKRYPQDIRAIRASFRSHGFSITEEQASSIWRAHSEEWAASWLDPSIHTGEELFDMLKTHFEVI